MKIVKNIDLAYELDEYEVILVGTNLNGAMGNGFQQKIRKLFPEAHELNINSPYGDPRKLGTILHTTESTPIIVLLYIVKTYANKDPHNLEYDALESSLYRVKELFNDKKIGTPLLGNSRFDGGGDRDRILDIFKKVDFNDITIYDYYQKSFQEENKETYSALMEIKKTDRDKFYKLMGERKDFYKKYGFFKTDKEVIV